ncbi:OmpA family protein [Hymenobacter sp. J193]|uniref:OmpA family protein n=1 Tax=Hymenobacter sp. J193 TaxID=2898429 RepID=UPI002150921E|nr:OmpA family protein [Hymenobacter sp. J193]MCR5889868.1 OmpA family protein [Hymenobacter sp. J193]
MLALGWLPLSAQIGGQQFSDARAGYQLTYPAGWWVQEEAAWGHITFYTGETRRQAPAWVQLAISPVPPSRKDLDLLKTGEPDSLWGALRRLPQVRILSLEQADAGFYQEVRYEYTYKAAAAGRAHVLGRRLWRNGYEYRLECQVASAADARRLAEGRQLVNSFALTGKGLPSRRYTDQGCDDKMYGIAALRVHDDLWEDDCRTIHEFSVEDPTQPPVVHSRVLPFQSYALAKGFDNCLYSVTKAPTDAPEYVYRYDPATRQGRYTPWRLPAQGGDNVWISAATDARGDLYFITSDAGKLVKVSPTANTVTTVWTADPVRQARYYPAIGFAGAGTHANFCLDENNTLYQVYSTNGTLLAVDLPTSRPWADLLPVDGLPSKGGYSDVVLQLDAEGNRVFYLAGPKALYLVDFEKRKATKVRRGVYTDLAGCNVLREAGRIRAAPALPATASWRGRVLDATTFRPLPEARLHLTGPATDTTLTVSAQGTFAGVGGPGQRYRARVQLPGYLAVDTTYTLAPGPHVRDVLLQPLALGSVLRLDKVQFEQGKAVLLTSSGPDLDRLLTLLTANPKLTIELRGHTDNVGDPQKNVLLSEQRVEVVKAYLVSHGVAAERITGLGLGGAEPRAANDQETTRRLNRRVEFRITGGK